MPTLPNKLRTLPARGTAALLATAMVLALSACAGGAGDTAASGSSEVIRDPGYSLKNAEITETNDKGEPRYVVRAAQAQQDPATRDIEMQTIEMQLRDQRGGEWQLRAQSGRMPEDAATVALRGGVVVNGIEGKGRDAVEMRTSALDVDTRSERVSTDQEVSITMSGRSLAARGMKADLKDRRLQLESAVHGRFKP